MALTTPLPSGIGWGSNPRPFDGEPSTLNHRPQLLLDTLEKYFSQDMSLSYLAVVAYISALQGSYICTLFCFLGYLQPKVENHSSPNFFFGVGSKDQKDEKRFKRIYLKNSKFVDSRRVLGHPSRRCPLQHVLLWQILLVRSGRSSRGRLRLLKQVKIH